MNTTDTQLTNKAELKYLWNGVMAIKTPHRCPVCEGHGQVAGGFFLATAGFGQSSSTVADICRPCGGTGIIYTANQ